MRFLKTNTATRVTVGPFLDKTDGITPETALTVTNCKLTFVVDDAGVPTLVLDTNPTASAGNNDMVHISGDDSGFYDLELTAANTNYVGRAMLALTDAANHCPVFHEFMILPALVYDSLVGGTDNLQVDTIQVGGTTQTARDIGASVLLSSGTGTGQVSLSSGTVTVGTNNDKTGYTAATVSDKTGYSLAADQAVNITKVDGVALSTHASGMFPSDLRDIVGAAVNTALAQLGVNVVTNGDKTGYTASTVSDKTGYSLAADQAVNVTKVGGTAQTAGDLMAQLTTLLARIVGTIAAGTHNAQSGDGYAILNSGTYGNSALKTLLDTTGIKIASNTDKTGYSLAADQAVNVTKVGGTSQTARDLGAQLDAAISTRSTYAGADTAGTTTLLSRVVGTLAAGTHNAQSGDAFGVVNSGTYGNSALKDLVDTVATYVDTEVGAIKTKTDQLVFTTPNKVDATATATIDPAVLQAAVEAALAAAGVTISSGTIDTIVNSTLTAIANEHGTGSYATPAMTIPLLSKASATAVRDGGSIITVSGNTPNFSLDLGMDCTGYDGVMAIRFVSGSTLSKVLTWVDQSAGTATVQMLQGEISEVGTHQLQVTISNSTQVLTALTMALVIRTRI